MKPPIRKRLALEDIRFENLNFSNALIIHDALQEALEAMSNWRDTETEHHMETLAKLDVVVRVAKAEAFEEKERQVRAARVIEEAERKTKT